MKKFWLNPLLLALTFCAISAASAIGAEVYVSGKLGMGLMQDADVNSQTLAAAGIDGTFEMETGYASAIAVGLNFDGPEGPLRFEAEAGYQASDADKLTLSSAVSSASSPINDKIDIMTGMLNAYIDIPMRNSKITPYLLGGIGLARITLPDTSATLSGTTLTAQNAESDVLAYQFGAGVAYPLSPQTILDFEYRYFLTNDPEFGNTDLEIFNHIFFIGVRHNF